MPPKRPARTFVIAPFLDEGRRIINRKKSLYNEVKSQARRIAAVRHGIADFAKIVESFGVGQRKRYGLVIDMDKLPKVAMHSPFAPFFESLMQYYFVQNPNTIRAAHIESIKVIRQLRRLGFNVMIQDPGTRERELFVRTAHKAGAVRAKVENESMPLPFGMTWARDQWVKIGGG